MHEYEPQFIVPPSWQTPAPLHVSAFTCVLPEHVALLQTVPFVYTEQAPTPLQVPVLPQVLAGS